ncbi:terminase small subunit [Mucilaginibacter kameinonensis]|uniref:terminase small subunit n=1 Tax=Mucilaginibacter kameinonensis TaxID=452286 RepID=UPI000EF7CFDC|nr:terminase small subunit [Mucilaginibacter kameinonensis]
MPFGIDNIMKSDISSCNSVAQVRRLIDNYFDTIKGEYHLEQKPLKSNKDNAETIEHKVWDREPEPATLSGLAIALGFNSRQEFQDYVQHGRFSQAIKQGILRIEAGYEAHLHQNTTGAMFALKSMGWSEKHDPASANTETENTLKVEIVNSGPPPACSEKDVKL